MAIESLTLQESVELTGNGLTALLAGFATVYISRNRPNYQEGVIDVLDWTIRVYEASSAGVSPTDPEMPRVPPEHREMALAVNIWLSATRRTLLTCDSNLVYMIEGIRKSINENMASIEQAMADAEEAHNG